MNIFNEVPTRGGNYWFNGSWEEEDIHLSGRYEPYKGIKLVYVMFWDGNPEFYYEGGEIMLNIVGEWFGPITSPWEEKSND